jgi:hypothetical protein
VADPQLGAVKVIGSPFNAFEDAVDACNTMLVELERLKSAGEVKRAGSAVPATSPRFRSRFRWVPSFSFSVQAPNRPLTGSARLTPVTCRICESGA